MFVDIIKMVRIVNDQEEADLLQLDLDTFYN
jgi:hypothetical protein